MRFDRFGAVLWIAVSSFSVLHAQEEDDFIENDGMASPVPAPGQNGQVPPPPTGVPESDGLFNENEELEPLREEDLSRPERDIDAGSTTQDFPEPRRPTTSSSRSSSTPRSLPPLPGRSGAIPKGNEKLRMDFVQVEIEEIVKYFAERLQQKFIYDPSILSGKVTIISPTEVTLNEAYGAFLSSMEVRGYVIYPAGKYLKIEKAANARKVPVPVYTGSTPNDDSFVTRIITLKFLSVNDIRQAVRNLLSRTGGDVIEHTPTNTLILSDYAYNIRRIVRILNILDVEGFQEQIEVIALKHASAQDVAKQINDFFPAAGGSSGASGSGLRSRSRGGAAAGGGGGEGQTVVQKVVPDDRTNSLIILGSDRGIEQVKKFIEKVDVPVAGGGGQIHVYALENVKAEDLQATLSALASGTQAKKRPSGGVNTPPAVPGQPAPPPTSSDASGGAAILGDVKITADAATNSLVIQSSTRDFENLKKIIKKLDVRRRQVFIESAILEASVGKTSAFGSNYSGPFAQTNALSRQDPNATGTTPSKSGFIGSIGNATNSLDGLLANPAALTGLALGFRSGSNFTFTTKGPNGDQKVTIPLLSAVIRLAAGSSNINVLSTPHILATANEEASLLIGEDRPQLSTTTRTDSGIPTQTFADKSAGTEITIKPQINTGDYLTLNIKQKVDEFGEEIPVGSGQFSKRKRQTATTVIVKDAQTVVMGGLMEDRKSTTVDKVPFLGDIPILGWLFKTRSTNVRKVNLLLFITPYIIRDTADMNDQFFRKLKERQGFLKDIGMDEKKNIPSSGLTPEQIKLLDPEYVKSLKSEQLAPLPIVPNPENGTSETIENLTPVDAPVTDEQPGVTDGGQQITSEPQNPNSTEKQTFEKLEQPTTKEAPSFQLPELSVPEQQTTPSGPQSLPLPEPDLGPTLQPLDIPAPQPLEPAPARPQPLPKGGDSGDIKLEDTPPEESGALDSPRKNT